MATIIKLNCINQELSFAENPLVASGGYNEDKLQINFCELWNGYAKVCVFYQNPNKHYFAMMEEDDTCVIPYEALQSDGILYLGVFGCNTEGKTRTSQIVKYVVEKGAININLQPEEPTPDIYEQFLTEVDRIRDYFIQLNEEKLCKHNFLTEEEILECINGTFIEKEEEEGCGDFVIYTDDQLLLESISIDDLLNILK